MVLVGVTWSEVLTDILCVSEGLMLPDEIQRRVDLALEASVPDKVLYRLAHGDHVFFGHSEFDGLVQTFLSHISDDHPGPDMPNNL